MKAVRINRERTFQGWASGKPFYPSLRHVDNLIYDLNTTREEIRIEIVYFLYPTARIS